MDVTFSEDLIYKLEYKDQKKSAFYRPLKSVVSASLCRVVSLSQLALSMGGCTVKKGTSTDCAAERTSLK